LKRHTELIRDHPAIPRIIFSDEVYSGRAERKDKMYQVLRRYLQEVGDIIRQGQKEKRIPGAGPPETLALMFVGLVVPGGILWHASDGKFDITRQVDRAWKVFQTQVLMK
ncbi:MAG: TetR/AcrR family transcriptional regulator, partial [Nitrospinaceae bacterium]|nr:TetR/AcrR family transcriptional regulator [Nitrospinaceae bacterium]NIS85911.1 TetR/AcrR family transcriptional regulator [Nitrospinaceae bacterium]NIT82759.1 TetR/AcrR family transcriptional regulator [Nitrospinaceae bacterium]NIU97130.1 TetR/AcrR family transcriptional regulator [Nitrospinaceae bacterium]NIY16027.1 TetR/AcrR family transcriptional regulator [Nitrospinaceae bacterium]